MNNLLVRRRLELLIDLGRDQLATHDLPILLDRTLRRALVFTDHDSGSIMLLDQAEGTLEVCASNGAGAAAVGTQVPNLRRSVAGFVLREGRPLILVGNGEAVGTEWRDYTRDIPSVICLPLLLSEGHPIGVLALMSTTEPRHLDAEDIETLQLLATQIAGVIENGRLQVERNQLIANLATSEQQLHELLGRLITAQEEERRRVAYDIHDGLAQMAASAYQHLQNVASRYRARNPQIRADFAQALDLLRLTVKEARALMMALRPAALDDLGLAVALRLEIEQFLAAGWQISFEEAPGFGRLPSMIETALFRTAQEALNNIRRHAGPTRVAVALRRDDHLVHLTIRDWGSGYVPPPTPAGRNEHLGIIGMQERARLLGGTCRVEGQPGCGTTVTVEIPLPPTTPHDQNGTPYA